MEDKQQNIQYEAEIQPKMGDEKDSLIYVYLLLVCVCVHACTHACHEGVEVRGQLGGVRSFIPLLNGFQGLNSGHHVHTTSVFTCCVFQEMLK